MNISLKTTLITIGFTLLAVTIVALIYFYKTQTSWISSEPYQKLGNQPAQTLVVVYSRTGNTFGLAKEIARNFNADLLEVKAPQYEATIKGQFRASEDADKKVITTPIEHYPVDFSHYKLIILCSPTWWFRPAVPLWSFVENHDFSGKPVFLVMTGNSRYKEPLIDKFSALVTKNNGDFLDLIFIRRGRIFWQKTPTEVNKEMQESLLQVQSLKQFLIRPNQ